ncbi:MAG: radical SAM protein [Nitrososphaerota archaeon]|nr:radical SAM protein [Candidatus Bathyarchaeota archaeon]MDW8062355.1 radical SAM protein [Nitrososphaerota archaeon]
MEDSRPRISIVECRYALTASRLPDLDYTLNPYVGCEHGCVYCYGRAMLRSRVEALSWGRFVKVKRNIHIVLAREIKSDRFSGVVGVSTVTDPYQPLESRYMLTRRCIEILSGAGKLHISVQTKSDLIVRDLDLMKPGLFDVGVTITTMDEDIAKLIEPRAPPPSRRVSALEAVSNLGVETWIFLGPIIPYLNDDPGSIELVVDNARRIGCEIVYDKLNLRRWVLDSMKIALGSYEGYPIDKLPSLTRRESVWWMDVRRRIEKMCREKGVRCSSAYP